MPSAPFPLPRPLRGGGGHMAMAVPSLWGTEIHRKRRDSPSAIIARFAVLMSIFAWGSMLKSLPGDRYTIKIQ